MPSHQISSYKHQSDYNKVLELFQLNTPAYFHPSEKAQFDRYLKTPGISAVVIKHQGQIAGFGGFQYDAVKKEGLFSWAFVHPEIHKRGLGSALVKHRINELTLLGANRIVVRTSQFTYRFYEKLGFVLESVTPNYWAKGFDLYYMWQQITPNSRI